MRKFNKNRFLAPDEPLKFEDHGVPMSRRQFIRQGFLTGSATMLTGSALSLFANPNSVRAAVSALPPTQRAALLLQKEQGLGLAEIADTLETTVGAMKSLLNRARKRLTAELEPLLEPRMARGGAR